MKLRVKEVAKSKGMELKDVAEKLGISYVALYKRINTPKLNSMNEIAGVLDCDVIELIEPKATHQHFYDNLTGEWLGIRKKY